MSSLKAKGCRRIKEVVASRDRISALPDDLLINILLLVSTKDVMATMLLSKRWRFVWTLVPKLEFDLEYKDIDNSVCRFLDKSMELHKARVLETLRLHVNYQWTINVVDARKWIAKAVDRYVRVLELELRRSTKLTKLPKSLYTCKTLVELTLSHKILVDVPSSACLPSLKKLLLLFVVYKNQDSLVRLLSSCSLLARSTIRLYVADNWRNTFPIKNVPGIRVFCNDDDKFLRSLPLVTSLTLCLEVPTAVNFSSITFSRLQRFKMRSKSPGWSNLLVPILNNSPKLQFLHIHSGYGYFPLLWNQPSFTPTCLSYHLEVFEWKRYRGRREEKQLVSYILANSKCLKKATITLIGKEKMVKELTSMSRASTMSQLLINGKT